MNINMWGVGAVLLSFAAFAGVLRAARSIPLRLKLWLLIPVGLLALPGASFALYYTHLFPEQAWFYSFRSVTGTELLLVFVGAAGGLLAAVLPEALRVLPMAGVTAFSIAPFLKPVVGPIPASAWNGAWNDDVCLQSTPSSCRAAALATVLRALGDTTTTEKALAKEAFTYAGGTEAWYLSRAARRRGFDVEFDLRSDFVPEGGLPAVVGVQLGSMGHFIAILAEENGRFVVGDPLVGRCEFSEAELRAQYRFSGFHLRVRSPGM